MEDLLAWKMSGACAPMDPVEGALLFFGAERETKEVQFARIKRAKAVCSTCPVETECLEYAMQSSDTLGIWGGKTERQRRTERSNRSRQRVAG